MPPRPAQTPPPTPPLRAPPAYAPAGSLPSPTRLHPPICSGVAAILALSSMLYANEVPPDQISLILAGCAAANYLVFDATKQGLVLALLCALACPAAELMIMHILQLWHYPGATLFTEIPHSGMLAWVPWCYFAYTPAVAQLTRYLKKTA